MSPLDPKRRVVVTGLGVVSSIGIGWEEFWKNLLAGKSGISKVDAFDTSNHDRHNGGQVRGDFSKFLTKKQLKKYGRASQMALAASKMAIKDAKINLNEIKNKNCSVLMGTTAWEMNVLEAINDSIISKGENIQHKFLMNILPGNTISSSIAEEFGLTGLNYVFGTACASGNYAVGYGYDLIRNGKTDFCLVGGADAMSRVVFTGFTRLHAVAPEKCQPFDLNRQGMIPAEGAGVLFLENLVSAKKRKAPIYAEIIGCGMSCDADHMTNPDPQSVARTMRNALNSAGVHAEDINYISAHGTGTIENDRVESEAYQDVFGQLKEKVSMSSIKSMLGHAMGAAAAFECIACCLTIKNNEIPPTTNFDHRDPYCNIDMVPNKSRKMEIDVALNNSLAFGGNNNCVILVECL